MLTRRPRRNRKSAGVRQMVQETQLTVDDFIFPLFLIEGENKKEEVSSMPGIYRYTLDLLLEEVGECVALGINAYCIFPSLGEDKKDSLATEGSNPEGIYQIALRSIKEKYPDTVVMTDVAMDPYSSDGHDGIVKEGKIVNDETLEVLGKMALAQAAAGADIIGPSDMMDGRIGYIREVLDDNGYTDVSIMSYSAKYASAFYGPFRDALDSAPKFGDKKTYQMDPANVKEALIEAELDYVEGADFLMVKPALSYLDVIKTLADNFDVPITAYNVSGEYAMLKAAAQNGWLENDKTMLEMLLSIKRAGASAILTYFAKEAAVLLNK
ncbi:porphobilinogen synthase [Flammeovirga kamogawensis]|uniref:Delta-aminolevulinic acid dehydratase n=1 Tax=Flammeovirga kamogawensis TaxID=373891 RepID=A0ABX8GZX4_9BACT|nr:porphobilinogen synthase [Flammeovirga kamogawensis]MBB6458916.1 porphobilinogen synthase [Flammeovirga kamogawensis]QWG08495.1 porphobilinogen synthase [Flammeovirga kamogawensis]TRX66790.1 porphobilinogen synthase [Flammeovirga kamogawensis]